MNEIENEIRTIIPHQKHQHKYLAEIENFDTKSKTHAQKKKTQTLTQIPIATV